VSITGFSATGLSGFNGAQTILYVDPYTFTFSSGVQATISGGDIYSTSSGFNNVGPVEVLTVPSPTTFTCANNFAGSNGTALPYTTGLTSATGSIHTYDPSYTGLDSAAVSWSQPAAFEINGMITSGAGITVSRSGYYKVTARIGLSSNDGLTYGNPVTGSYASLILYVAGTAAQISTTQVVQQSAAYEYALVISDVVYIDKNQTITAYVSAFTPVNSGQIYAWANASLPSTASASYMSAVLVSS
jgi:hypothetical protein